MRFKLAKDLISGKIGVSSNKPEGINEYRFIVKTKNVFGEAEKEYVLESTSEKNARITLNEQLVRENRNIIGFEIVSIEESSLLTENFGNLKGIPADIAKRFIKYSDAGRDSKVEELVITSMDGFNSKVSAWAKARAKEAGKDYAAVVVYFKTENGQDAYITQASPQKWNFYYRSEKSGQLVRAGDVRPSGLNIQLPQKIVLISPDYARIQKRAERFAAQHVNDPLAVKNPFSGSSEGSSTFDYESGMKVLSKYYDEVAAHAKRINNDMINSLMVNKDFYSYKTRLAAFAKALDSVAWYAMEPSKIGENRMTANDLKRAVSELKKLIETLKKMWGMIPHIFLMSKFQGNLNVGR